LLGYERGQYEIHALVDSYVTGAGYDPSQKLSTLASDWAILTLVKPLPHKIRSLDFAKETPPIGTTVMVASYARGRRHVLTADKDCRLLRIINSPALLETDCQGAQGTSGAPLLVPDGERVRFIGLQVAIRQYKDMPTMLAVPAQNIEQGTRQTQSNR
jgi:protease YdgD